MKAIILAAGRGERLRPLTEVTPKPMLPVGGRPLLERLVQLLRRHGVEEIAINLCHRSEVIQEHFGDGGRWDVHITYSIEERPLGSAGGVKRLAPFLDSESFFVVYGDLFTDIDLTSLGTFHAQQGAALTMGLCQPEDPSQCGIVQLGPDGRVVAFNEKPASGWEPSSWANAGVYVVEPAVLQYIPQGRFDFGADLFPLLLRCGVHLSGYKSDALVVDIGTPRGYERAQQLAASRYQGAAACS